jgi:hypothetical protein
MKIEDMAFWWLIGITKATSGIMLLEPTETLNDADFQVWVQYNPEVALSLLIQENIKHE